MDAIRFDALSRTLSVPRSRRRSLLTTLGMVLGTFGRGAVDDARAAKSGKCQRQPGECETCKKGKCERKNGKKSCKAGKLQPKASGTACTGGTCQNGQCLSPTGEVILPPPRGCVPEPQATTCAQGCGNQLNNCNQLIPCLCASEQICLPNGTCARACTPLGGMQCAGCAPVSACGTPTIEGVSLCLVAFAGESADLSPCDPPNTTGCPQGFACINHPVSGPRCAPVGFCLPLP